MSDVVIRVRPETFQKSQDLAREDGISVSDLIDKLAEDTRRARIFKQASEAYAAIAADPEADAEWRAEIAVWDVTIADGLPVEPGLWDEDPPSPTST